MTFLLKARKEKHFEEKLTEGKSIENQEDVAIEK